MKARSPGMMMIGGAALIVIGSFLPWVQVRTIFGTIAANGIDGDGILTLVAGAIIAVLGFTSLGRAERGETQGLLRLLTLVFLAGVLLVAFVDFVNISEQVADKIGGMGPSYGPGLFLIIGGAGVAMIGAFRIPKTPLEPDRTPSAPPSSPRRPDNTPITDLERLHDLHSSGAITDAEYQLAKSRLLESGS